MSAYKNQKIERLSHDQLKRMEHGSFEFFSEETAEFQDLILENLKNETAPLTFNNSLDIFTDGNRKFDALLADIRSAENHVHLQYYIFKNDEIGRRLIDLLIEKALEGVKVLILYDDVGSKKLPKEAFEGLFKAGGKAVALLPSKLLKSNPRIYYRYHRKIVVIDGHISYIGGFNVGNEYVGKSAEFGYWRDTHLRIQGNAVHSLQHRFLLDWNRASKKHSVKYDDAYFPSSIPVDGIAMQTISSGPDSSFEQIKNGFLKMIDLAKSSILIQTPYIIPDDAFLEALRKAAFRGVDVRVMIPIKSDHPFVDAASLSFTRELMAAGIIIYQYSNGFLHAKTIIVDSKVFSVGSANMDIRSFSLNYEANVFVYDREMAKKMVGIFLADAELSKMLTIEAFRNRSLIDHIKERVARLMAPIL